MCRHFGSVAILAPWTFGSYTLKLLSRDGRASFEGMFKSNQRRAGQDHQGWRLALTAGKTTPNKR